MKTLINKMTCFLFGHVLFQDRETDYIICENCGKVAQNSSQGATHMTREELLYQIEEEASYQKLIDVLRAVMELHNASPEGRYEKSICVGCSFTETGHLVFYPCRIIQAIEKEIL